jgi:hypothetical protein
MGSKWDIEKFTGSNDFGLWKVKMQAVLTQQKCTEILKGQAAMSANLTLDHFQFLLKNKTTPSFNLKRHPLAPNKI